MEQNYDKALEYYKEALLHMQNFRVFGRRAAVMVILPKTSMYTLKMHQESINAMKSESRSRDKAKIMFE